MEFDRAVTVAVKIFLVSFSLYLLGVIFLVPLILSGNLLFAIIVGFVLGLFGLAVTVYFILEEAEKMDRETESHVETRRYDNQIRDLRRRIDEISKVLPKETLAKLEDIKPQCPQCGKEVPKDFKLCPYCGTKLK